MDEDYKYHEVMYNHSKIAKHDSDQIAHQSKWRLRHMCCVLFCFNVSQVIFMHVSVLRSLLWQNDFVHVVVAPF